MATHNKLSITLIADAFAVEEKEPRNGTVFAILGQEETIRTVQRFLKAMYPDYDGNLWGRPLLVDESVKHGTLTLAVHNGGRLTEIGDFMRVFQKSPFTSTTTGVWTTVLDIR